MGPGVNSIRTYRCCFVWATMLLVGCTAAPQSGTISRPVQRTEASAPEANLEADWLARSTAPGVLYANDLRTASDFEAGRFPDSNVDNVTRDSSRSLTGGHSVRFAIRKEHESSSGNWRVRLRPSGEAFGEGDRFYVQYRLYIPREHLRQRYQSGGGWKTSIISAHFQSFTDYEVVINNSFYGGYAQGYYRGRDWAGEGVVFVGWQPGGWRTPKWRADEWQTLLQRIKVGNFDRPNSTLEVWFARQGRDYQRILRHTKVWLGPLGGITKAGLTKGLRPYGSRPTTLEDSWIHPGRTLL